MATVQELTPKIAGAVDSDELRQEVIDACLELTRSGQFIGTWGNISVRLDSGLLVTPSRVDYHTMSVNDLVVLDWDGARIAGHRLPTSELHVHRLLLKARPDLGTFIHTHGAWASVLACRGTDLPCIVEDMAQLIGGDARCSKYVPGGHHLELAHAAVDAIGGKSTSVLLANHGVIVGGRTLRETIVAGLILEKAAMIYVNAMQLGGCTSLPDEIVDEERFRYLYKYGNASDFS